MSNLNNVALWFAKDNNGNTVTINKLKDEYKEKYFCPLCGSEVIPKALESTKVSPHFAHLNREACSGESVVHWWVKNELIKKDDVFEVVTNESNQLMCKEILLEQAYETPYGIYKPDISMLTHKNETVFVEVNFTNKKNVEDYYLKWKHLGNTVIEFSIKNVYSEEDNKVIISNSFNAIYYKDMIFTTNKDDKEYRSYRSGIESKMNDKSIEKLKEIEWFIDDIYRYNKNYIDIEDIKRSFLSIKNIRDYKAIMVSLYKNSKCQKAIRDIILNIESLISKELKYNTDKWKYDIDFKKISTKRLVEDRIFGSFNVRISFEQCVEYLKEDAKIFIENYKDDLCFKLIDESYRGYNLILPSESYYDYSYSKTIVFSIFDIIENEPCHFVNEINSYIGDTINRLDDKEIAINENKESLKYICDNNFMHSHKIANYICEKHKELIIDYDYIDIHNRYIDDYKISIEKIIPNCDPYEDVIKTNRNLLGMEFCKLKPYNVNSLIYEINKEIKNYKIEYRNAIDKCEKINKDMVCVKYKYGSIFFDYVSDIKRHSFEIKNETLKEHSIPICRVCDSDYGNIKEKINDVVNILYKNDDVLIGENIIDICKKLEYKYTNQTNIKYKIEKDLDGIKIYCSGFNGNKVLISNYKCNSDTKYEEVSDKFADDVRKYLYKNRRW